MENIHDPHNVSAIFRSCDAAGIPKVSLIYNFEKFPKIGKKSSASAFKWIEKEKYKSVDECFTKLRKDGFKIFTTTLEEGSKEIYSIDFTEKIAFVLGNEHRGASEEAIKSADGSIYIPQYGMVQSLNVSVAAAIIIYEALRQRRNKKMYLKSELSEVELKKQIDEWIFKK